MLKLTRQYREQKWDVLDNYPAININKSCDILYDYPGVMAVPVTYFGKFDFKRYRILGYTGGVCFDDINLIKRTKHYINAKQHKNGRIVNGSKINTECAVLLDRPPDKCYYTADNANGYLLAKYGRLLIQKI